ncbi:MAG TPA: hypothetical protein VGO47_14440 [Chlamydiales bacterium]|nr:hypothetical protein [Chlamydiales bacterium]
MLFFSGIERNVHSVKPKSTWALLKDHFEQLISASIFPLMCFNEAKAELWDTDPIDFVRESTGMWMRRFWHEIC